MATTHQTGHGAHSHGPHTHGDDHGHGHAVPLRLYYVTFAWLMGLLVLTLAVAAFDLPGPGNIIVAMTVAVVKALFVVCNFMHVRYGTRLVKVFAGAALFWLIILFALTLGDYFARRGPMLPMGPG